MLFANIGTAARDCRSAQEELALPANTRTQIGFGVFVLRFGKWARRGMSTDPLVGLV